MYEVLYFRSTLEENPRLFLTVNTFSRWSRRLQMSSKLCFDLEVTLRRHGRGLLLAGALEA